MRMELRPLSREAPRGHMAEERDWEHESNLLHPLSSEPLSNKSNYLPLLLSWVFMLFAMQRTPTRLSAGLMVPGHTGTRVNFFPKHLRDSLRETLVGERSMTDDNRGEDKIVGYKLFLLPRWYLGTDFEL